MTFSMKNSVLDNFPPCPPAQPPPPEKHKFYFYCRLAFSELFQRFPGTIPRSWSSWAVEEKSRPGQLKRDCCYSYFRLAILTGHSPTMAPGKRLAELLVGDAGDGRLGRLLANVLTALRHSEPKERPQSTSFEEMKQGQKLEHDGIAKCEVFGVDFFGCGFWPLTFGG